jgi:hypothetical protein
MGKPALEERRETNMPSLDGAQLSQIIHRKIEDLKTVCKGVDENTASRAPAGRWSPKEILSHLCGPEGAGFMPAFRAILEQDIPRLDIEAENPFFTGNRSRMTFDQLLGQVEREYDRMAELATGLSDKQLTRKAHIPLFKEAPFGEYPTLAVFIRALGEHHLGSHIDHLREILQALGVAPAGKKNQAG